MFFQNLLTILIASIFLGISFSYIFSTNIFLTLIYSSIILFLSFFISYIFSEKIYIKPIFKLNILGMIISILLLILKIPFFPILSIEEIYYYSKARKIFERKITSKEIGKIALAFLLVLLIFGILGILLKNFLLTFLSSILILSFLFPYKNSLGSILFFYSFFYFSFFLLCSIVFLAVSLIFLI